MRVYIAFVLFLHLIVGMGLGFLTGANYQKKIDLEHCKSAGWAFIEEAVLERSFAENHPRGSEYGIQRLMDYQSNIATKCINRIK